MHGLVFVARITKIDHLDRARALVLEQDILRLQVTMADALVVEQLQALEYGDRKAFDQIHAEALVVVLSNQLVDVHAEQFERYADVPSKHKVVVHVNHIVLIVRIFFK